MFKAHDANKCLVIIQCDSGHLNGDLIACARYRIYDFKARIDEGLTTHVLFVIHLPQQVASSSFVGLQGDPWISAHIDDLRPPSDNTVAPDKATTMTMSELFMGKSSRLRSEPEEKLEIPSYNDLGGSDMEGDSYKEMEASGSIEDSGEYDRNVEMQRDIEDMTGSDSEDEEKDSIFQKKRWAKKNPHLRVPRGEGIDEEIEGNSQPMYDSTMSVDDIEDEELTLTAFPTLHSGDNLAIAESVNYSSPEPVTVRSKNDKKLTGASQIATVEMEVVESTSPLYTRLHSCIQAAASRLKDDAYKRSTKRVQLLVQLIPKNILDLGMTQLIIRTVKPAQNSD